MKTHEVSPGPHKAGCRPTVRRVSGGVIWLALLRKGNRVRGVELPQAVPVMTIPNVSLFPQAMLPLHIFESRYRRMLADSLESHRMFSVAMQKPGRTRECPSKVAGLGLIRASVANQNGTSNLILQGIARVELTEVVQYRPYRVHRIRPLQPPRGGSDALDALAARVRELVGERLAHGFPASPRLLKKLSALTDNPSLRAVAELSLEHIVKYLTDVEDSGQLADVVACSLLTVPQERQVILETLDLELRLRYLVRFLTAEIDRPSDAPPL